MHVHVLRTVGEANADLHQWLTRGSLGGLASSAHLCVELKPPIRSKHHYSWGSEGVFRGKEDAEVVEPALEFRARGAADGTVPFLQHVRR